MAQTTSLVGCNIPNIAWAKQALRYVQQKLTLGTSNRREDLISTRTGSMWCAIGSYRELKAMNLTTWSPAYIESLSVLAEKNRCGNCGSQAAVAYHYLKRLQISPIDYMMYAGGDHAFVVIGRDSSSKLADYKTWGKDAVVCDPWGGIVCAASEIPNSGMYGGWEGGFVSKVRS